MMLMSLVLIIAAVINAVIFGQFAVLTEEVKAGQNEYMEKLDMINTVLVEQKLSTELSRDVRRHIATTHSLKKL